MSEPKIKLSKTELSQTLNLSDIVGKDISSDPMLVSKIGQAVVDYMLDRIDNGKGRGGVALHKPYSDEYSNSLDFKAAGKSKNDVNMRLSGDMLSSIDFSQEGDEITIKIDNESQAIKAYGHQTGFRGHPYIKGPKREFFGVTVDELKKVTKEFKKEIDAVNPEQAKAKKEEYRGLRAMIRTVADLFD